MEEEKKENVTTEATPEKTAPVETPAPEATPVESTPAEEVKEEPVSKVEEKVEDEDDEPIEMLEGACVMAPEPEPEPESELISNTMTRVNEVVISSEPTSTPEPEPAAPPVVHKVEDSPIANAEAPKKVPEPAPAPEPKKEEPKVEEKKEEPKKEEKKPKDNNNKLAIILMVVALIVGAGYAVKTFILDAQPASSGTPSSQQGQQPSGGGEGGSGTEPSTKMISRDEAMKLISDLIVNDSIDANYQPIERLAKSTTVLSTDLTNDEVFYITYNKYFKNLEGFAVEDFQNKVAMTLADVTYTPESYSGDCNDRVFEYDETAETFKIELLNLACAIEGYDSSVHDLYGYLGNTIDGDELVISIGVFFGKGTDDTKEDEYYYDFDRNNPVADGVITKTETGVDENATDFKRATKYDITFNVVDGNYVFVKAEQA